MCLPDWLLQLRFKNYKIHRFFEIQEIKQYWKSDSFCNHKLIRGEQESNDYLRELICTDKHFFVARTGGVEAEALCDQDMVERHTMLNIPEKVRYAVRVQAGMFSNDDAGLHRFLQIYQDAWKEVTHYAYWQIDGNKRIVQRWLNKDAVLFSFRCLKAVHCERPYLLSFCRKKVLIVSPFAQSIRRQYKNKHLLFSEETLPDFELLTYCPVLSYGDCQTSFASWEDALLHMYAEIKTIACDIVILSCGAYGLPLGSMLYKDGYNVLHIGGMTQCWFGIRGKAYDRDEDIIPLINQYWVRPTKEETPSGFQKIEGGNYW